MHKTSNEFIQGISNSVIANNERNDCFVRSLAASFNMEYDLAHEITKNKFKVGFWIKNIPHL